MHTEFTYSNAIPNIKLHARHTQVLLYLHPKLHKWEISDSPAQNRGLHA